MDLVRALVVLAVLLAALYGCDQTSSPVEPREKGGGVEEAQDLPRSREEAGLPAHSVTQEGDCSVGWGFPVKCYSITTNDTHKEALTRLTDFFRDENPSYDAVLISYHPDGASPSVAAASSGPISGSASAAVSAQGWAFRNETVARAVLGEQWRSPQAASVQPRLDEQVSQAMRNDGIAIFSSVEEDRELRQEMGEITQQLVQDLCADWDPEDWGASAAGTPPPEWNCPGY
jgi:hypothetical protein